MPAYTYTCRCCQITEVRITAISDRIVGCEKCGCPMERQANTAILLASYNQAATSRG